MSTPDLLAAALRIKLQLDARSRPDIGGMLPVITQGLKVAEEAGELAQAINGVIGENPRKGKSHTVDDVMHEALDVALSALVLGERAGPDRFAQVVADRLEYLRKRAEQSGAPDVERR